VNRTGRALGFLGFLALGCRDGREAPDVPRAPGATATREDAPAEDRQAKRVSETEGPIRMEVLDPAEQPPMYVMRGAPRGPERMVFLHGMCGHALGYAQAFQFAAARKGTLIAPQGDRSCGAPWAAWSGDLEALDRRIRAAFVALGREPSDILALGYSQGASRAEALAHKWPERYTRLVLIAAPTVVKTSARDSIRGAVMMAGERDRRDLMKAGVGVMTRAGIPCAFFTIPEATHGSMGPTPEKTMGEALEWLSDHEKPR
jgi:pimeloyl-ACP methyl ester carboxylesterase